MKDLTIVNLGYCRGEKFIFVDKVPLQHLISVAATSWVDGFPSGEILEDSPVPGQLWSALGRDLPGNLAKLQRGETLTLSHEEGAIAVGVSGKEDLVVAAKVQFFDGFGGEGWE